MGDVNRSEADAPEGETTPSWDLIPDERAPTRSIIMRFASHEAAHAALTDVGFSPTSGSVQTLRLHDARTAVRYAHPDGSTVVLARQPADLRGTADPREEHLGLATVGG